MVEHGLRDDSIRRRIVASFELSAGMLLTVERDANLYAMDNDALYPESVATVGPEGHWNWQEPMKLLGYSTREARAYTAR